MTGRSNLPEKIFIYNLFLLKNIYDVSLIVIYASKYLDDLESLAPR